MTSILCKCKDNFSIALFELKGVYCILGLLCGATDPGLGVSCVGVQISVSAM